MPDALIQRHDESDQGTFGRFFAGFRSQLNGCIALGERLGYMDGQKALLLSAPAMRRLESFSEDDLSSLRFEIQIEKVRTWSC